MRRSVGLGDGWLPQTRRAVRMQSLCQSLRGFTQRSVSSGTLAAMFRRTARPTLSGAKPLIGVTYKSDDSRAGCRVLSGRTHSSRVRRVQDHVKSEEEGRQARRAPRA